MTKTTTKNTTPAHILRVGRLKNTAEVVDEMARVYRSARRDEIPVSTGAKLIFMLREIRAAIEARNAEMLYLKQKMEAQQLLNFDELMTGAEDDDED